MKYIYLIIPFLFFSNSSCESSKNEKNILVSSAKSQTSEKAFKKNNCNIQIEDNNLIIICGNEKKVYKNLIVNEMSISTELINEKAGEFSLLYELNASSTKVKEKYSFIYSSGKLLLIYKEVLKFGKEGIMLNGLYFDDYDMSHKTIEDLQSLGNNLSEEFSKQNSKGFIYDSKNSLFAYITNKSSIEDLYISYPILEKVHFNIINVESANNQAYNLEKINANNFSKLLLKDIIKQYPNRIVAFLNLADVDWKLYNKEAAKKSYKQYLSLMKSQNKDLKRIPQRVYERVK